MANINGYQTIGELKSTNSGYAKWGFARKNGVEVFIKEFLSPVYPVDTTVLSEGQILHKRRICEEFYAEKRAFYDVLNRCSTGNIVTTLDFFRFGSRYYTVTEKVDAVKIDPMEIFRHDLHQKKLIMKIILHCVNSLHVHGIVHGDIKPDNILFKRTKKGMYTAKIIDFDSSFLESSPPKTDEDFQGDLVYLAPESFLFMAEAEGGVLSTKIDVFALGVLFHQYMSGRLPGYDTSKYDYVFEAVLDGYKLNILDTIPRDVRELITRMLDRYPAKRPTVSEAFEALSGKPLTAPEVVEKPAGEPVEKTTGVVVKTMGSSGLIKSTMKTKPDGPITSVAKAPETIVKEPKKTEKPTTSSFFKSADDLL